MDMSKVVGIRPQDTGISYLDAPTPKPFAVNATESEPIPEIVFTDPLDLPGATLSEALTLVLAGTGIGSMIAPGVPASATAQIAGLKGSLASVLRVLSEAYGVFFTYSEGTLKVEPERQYLIELPPVKELAASIEKVLTQRGATAVSVDQISGQVSYKATYSVSNAIRVYLEAALTQPLLVLELNVIEVRLNAASKTGIQWDKLNYIANGNTVAGITTNSPLGAGVAAGGMAMTANIGSKLSLGVLLNFLATQGTVSTVSQPRVQFLSGGKTELKIGDTIRYVSAIGATQVGNSASAQTTATVTDLDTGIKLTVGGRYSQDTVYANIAIEMSDLLGFDTVTLGPGQSQQLPRTTKRMLGENMLRMRPGETEMLFGLITTSDSRDRQSLTNAPILGDLSTTGANSSKSRNELVIVVRPKVIKFGKPPTTGAEQ